MAQPKETLWKSEPRTLLKHRVYRSYLNCWMPKILQGFPRAAVVDAFAGPGRYLDGPDGSPLVIAKTYLEHVMVDRFKTLDLVCSEGRADRNQRLRSELGTLPSDPRLRISVKEPGDFAEQFESIRTQIPPTAPTLWILDPFTIADVPFELVKRCLQNTFDEVLITWFADEIFRFHKEPHIEATLMRHYGDDSWRRASGGRGESAQKTSLQDVYCKALERLPDVRTRSFAISSKNLTARYSIVFATHSDHGLRCWNPMAWKLDPREGRSASEREHPGQRSLFEDISRLLALLRGNTDSAVSFLELERAALTAGFGTPQLRRALSELAADDIAVRERPLEAPTPWPENSVVRFYEVPPDEG